MKKFSIFNFQFSKNGAGPAPSLNNRNFSKPKAFGCCSAGFTLIETITAIFVFSIVAILSVGIFVGAAHIQSRAFGAQRIVENTLPVLESMARDIRVSRICIAGSSCSLIKLDIVHPLKGSLSYFLNPIEGTIKKTESGSTVDITSSDLNFTKLEFKTSGLAVDDQRQPKITILISVQNKVGQIVSFNLQTTVTSRDFSDEFQN